MNKCNECERLRGQVQDVLARLTHLTTAQVSAFRGDDHATFMRLDKELETAVGRKSAHLEL